MSQQPTRIIYISESPMTLNLRAIKRCRPSSIKGNPKSSRNLFTPELPDLCEKFSNTVVVNKNYQSINIISW